MKKTIIILVAAVFAVACADSEKKLMDRATELCKYIPDHELLEQSKDYMTADFYAVLDTMFNHLPEHEAMDHEWLYYFVTSNGGTIADYEVTAVEQTDKTHAIATIKVKQKWEDGSFDENADVEEHQLAMEKVNGVWLMSDFDGHKQDCIRHITINHKEEAMRQAISDYLVAQVGQQYQKGERCIPTLMIAASEEEGSVTRVWGDFWVFWYNASGDTLKTVSGGDHPGRMTLEQKDGKPTVTSFEQTVDGTGYEASAKRIFGNYYDVFQNMHSNAEVREEVRKEQLKDYVGNNNLSIRYYQDYGRDAVALSD